MSTPLPQHIERALLIRTVEETLFSLYGKGLLSGTIHACIGQELSAVAVCGQLAEQDFVFSNHRCHGHFLALTGDVKGLVAELSGKRSGVCGGVGGSQHLCVKDRFYSNGIQGGIMPVAAGRALAEKLNHTQNIGVVFIGEGTLGQGVVYETANIAAKWGIPLLIVLENNRYSQSTPQDKALSGDIRARFEAFGIQCFEGACSDYQALADQARQAAAHVRTRCEPAFLRIDTYRLCSHSKSDDCRDEDEVARYGRMDPLNLYAEANPEAHAAARDAVKARVDAVVEAVGRDEPMPLAAYLGEQVRPGPTQWREFDPAPAPDRYVSDLNKAFHSLMAGNEKVVFLGEDIHSPYGGAFKATKGLSDAFPDRTFTTPISEQAITGVANGLALGGFRPVLEIMFGDFVTLCMDQIVNHASKFHHMYNHQADCPVTIRTPMGGHRGYGPTHSQTLDKFLAGVDNVTLVALNQLIPPGETYETLIGRTDHPHIVIENKADYSRRPNLKRHPVLANYRLLKSGGDFPAVRLEPRGGAMDACIITYGGCAEDVLKAADALFTDHEILAGIIVLGQIHPIDPGELHTGASRIYVVEEGSAGYGFGSEVLALLAESGKRFTTLKRIASLPVPIPAAPALEKEVLVTAERIIQTIANDCHE